MWHVSQLASTTRWDFYSFSTCYHKIINHLTGKQYLKDGHSHPVITDWLGPEAVSVLNAAVLNEQMH